jgi:hypothetical protein
MNQGHNLFHQGTKSKLNLCTTKSEYPKKEETIMTEITCIYCGVEGILNVHGLDNDESLNVFKRVGRNHVSGHLHYQCPVCKSVLLVDPVLVREGDHIFKKKVTKYPVMPLGSTNTNNFPGIYSMLR